MKKEVKFQYDTTEKGKKYKYCQLEEYTIIPIETNYIKPNESLDSLINKVKEVVRNDDYLLIAETPIAISQGRVVDESKYTPSLKAKFLAKIWSKYLWGYILGPLLGIKKRTIKNLRRLPKESEVHKEVVLDLYGWKHALKPASEAGIDLSNAPGTLVSLLPENPEKVAKEIASEIKNDKEVNKDITVLIVDTDATYKRKGKYFTGLPEAIDGIESNKGVIAYTMGQLSENCGPTPIASSKKIDIEKALKLANISEDYQKSLPTSMETIHSVKKVLNTNEGEVTIEKLDSIIHTPAAILRKR